MSSWIGQRSSMTRLVLWYSIDVKLRSLDLGLQHTRKQFGLVEVPPYDSRLNQYDSTPSHLVQVQDLPLVVNDDLPMDMYPQDNGMRFPSDVAQDPALERVDSHHGANYFMQDKHPTNAHQQSPLDQRGIPAPQTISGLSAPSSRPTRSSSRGNKAQPIIHQQKQPGRKPVVLPSNTKGSRPRVNSTSRTLLQTPEELTSAMTSNILGRLDSSKYNKTDLELAVQASVLSIIGSNQTNKKRSHEEISPLRNGPKSLFPCHYCPKKKKTQCDLTYVFPQFLST